MVYEDGSAGDAPRIDALLLSCADRSVVRRTTLASFAKTDWGEPPLEVLDDGTTPDRVRSITATWRRLLERALEREADFHLALEDDLEFNAHLRQNLLAWAPLRQAARHRPFFGSLYNPGRTYLLRDPRRHFLVIEPNDFWGSQALVLSHATVAYLLRFWDPNVAADVLIGRSAARVTQLFQHTPSLVQHTGVVSTWGGIQHAAHDYDPAFRVEAVVQREPHASAVW